MKKHQALLTIQAKLKLDSFFFLFLTLSKSSQVCARGGKVWSRETLLYPNISDPFYAVMEKLLIFNMFEI